MRLNPIVRQLILLALASTLYPNAAKSSGSWQTQRLFHPTRAVLASETRGRIFIYSGLKDKVVDKALDEHFDRIDAMMFTKTIRTDTTGTPLRDSVTGEVITEDDGCD